MEKLLVILDNELLYRASICTFTISCLHEVRILHVLGRERASLLCDCREWSSGALVKLVRASALSICHNLRECVLTRASSAR